MIQVIAKLSFAAGKRDALQKLIADLLPKVHAESGCVEYQPATEVPTGLEVQTPVDEGAITMVEKWDDVDALKRHLEEPHMADFFAATEGIITGVEVQVYELS